MESRLARRAFFLLCAFILAVSVYDAWLVVKYRGCILDNEQNPFCRMLIQTEPRFLSLFLLSKGAGTALVIGTLFLVLKRGRRLAFPVAGAVALFQLHLLMYLTLDLPRLEISAPRFSSWSRTHRRIIVTSSANGPTTVRYETVQR